MNKDFKFEQVGKRMPYTVPDGFFDELEDKLLEKVHLETPRKSHWHIFRLPFVLTIASIAAAMFIFIFNANMRDKKKSVNELAKIDKAFNNLNTDDQTYLLDAYQNDVFFNDN